MNRTLFKVHFSNYKPNCALWKTLSNPCNSKSTNCEKDFNHTKEQTHFIHNSSIPNDLIRLYWIRTNIFKRKMFCIVYYDKKATKNARKSKIVKLWVLLSLFITITKHKYFFPTKWYETIHIQYTCIRSHNGTSFKVKHSDRFRIGTCI